MKDSRRRFLTTAIAGLGLQFAVLGLTSPAFAQEASYPSQPIRMIVPFAPGGGNDVFARTVSPAMGEFLGQSVIIENRAGASGSIGAASVARTAQTDGYTVLLAEVSILSVNEHLQKNLSYDPKDLAPVAKAGTYDYVLVVNPRHIDVKNFQELQEYSAKSSKGLNYGVPGIGTPHHLGMELLISRSGLKADAIAYRGSAPAVQDLLSGQIDLMLADRAAARTHIKAGTLRAIAVAGAKRTPEFPDVPTLAESGVDDFAMESWFGFAVRKGTPQAYIDKLAASYRHAIQNPELVARLSDVGINVTFEPADQFATFIENERQRWGMLIEERGIKAE